jgi:hypothetical protein
MAMRVYNTTSPDQMVAENYIQWAMKAIAETLEDYERYENYYVGDHVLEFSTAKWDEVFESTFEELADNWCAVVVDSAVQRLKITGWKAEDESTREGKSLASHAEDIWDRNRMDVEEIDVHTQGFIKGDSYLMVWENPDDPTQAEIYYNDATEVTVYYDPANHRRVIRGAKRYKDESNNDHLCLYFPNYTQEYIVPSNMTPDQVAAFAGNMMDVASLALPSGFVPAGDEIPNEYGIVPIFHFKNRSIGSTYGVSELKSIIPIQNAINKLLMDLMIASEFGSFRQKYIAGGGQPKDGWKSTASRIWATTDSQTKFGEFGQTDLEPIFKAIEVLVGHIAKISQTPMHYLRSSGDVPSGEALKTAESGLVKKCIDRQQIWGEKWSQMMTFALQIEGETPEHPVRPVWESAETRHDLEQAQTAQLKSILGIPLETLWAEHFNYTEEEIRSFREQNKALVASVLAQVIAQVGQLPPGTEGTTATPEQLVQLLQVAPDIGNDGEGTGLDISQVLALLPKGVTAQTTAGEATTKPQPNTNPPASPTRRSRGFKD